MTHPRLDVGQKQGFLSAKTGGQRGWSEVLAPSSFVDSRKHLGPSPWAEARGNNACLAKDPFLEHKKLKSTWKEKIWVFIQKPICIWLMSSSKCRNFSSSSKCDEDQVWWVLKLTSTRYDCIRDTFIETGTRGWGGPQKEGVKSGMGEFLLACTLFCCL